MEIEKNQKKSWLTRLGFAIYKRVPNPIKNIMPGKKTFATMLLLTLSPGIGQANINDQIVTVQRNNVKIASDVQKDVAHNPIDLNSNNPTVSKEALQAQADKRSNSDKIISGLSKASRGLNSINDLSNSMSNLGRSRDLSSLVRNAENTVKTVEKSEQTFSKIVTSSKAQEKKNDKVQNDNNIITKNYSDDINYLLLVNEEILNKINSYNLKYKIIDDNYF